MPQELNFDETTEASIITMKTKQPKLHSAACAKAHNLKHTTAAHQELKAGRTM